MAIKQGSVSERSDECPGVWWAREEEPGGTMTKVNGNPDESSYPHG